MVQEHESHDACCAACEGDFRRIGDEKPDRKKIILMIAGAAGLAGGLIMELLLDISGTAPLVIYIISYLLLGSGVLLRAFRNIMRGKVFDENFLMAIATIGAFVIGEYAEAVAVMLFYQVGEFFQESAVRKSKRNIAELMDIRPDYANLMRENELVKVAPEEVETGDIIIIKPGEKIPLDGEVTEGESSVDTTALTGESVPRRAAAGDTVLSGCVNLNGLLTVKVTKTFGESTASKIIDLVENASGRKAPTENFITKFARYYTPAVVGIALLIAVIPALATGGLSAEWFRRGLIFLVISCPCALVISIPLSFFGGVGGASRRGILVKGGNYLEALADLETVVFDKTGTLTKGMFAVTAACPADGFSRDELLETAAKAEAYSNHPIALSVLREYGGDIDRAGLTGYNERAGLGVSVNDGVRKLSAGNEKMMTEMGVTVKEPKGAGTKVYVSIDGAFVGSIVISDEIKPDSAAAVAALKEKGVGRIVMLTGDDPQIAMAVAAELKIDEAHGGLLPHQKVEKLEILLNEKRKNGKLAFVGDGINDAPVLAIADVGVAMGGLGSDAAIEASDVVLMTDEPLKLAEAVETARFTKRIVWQNIAFALGVKGLFMLLGAFGIATLWEAVFADVGVALLAILNATRVMK